MSCQSICRPLDAGYIPERAFEKEEKKTDDVDDVDVFAAFVLFAFDPVAVEVGEEPVDVGSAGRVAVPLAGVVAEEGFVGQVGGLLQRGSSIGEFFETVSSLGVRWAYLADLFEVADKVLLEVLVEVGSHQVGAAWVDTGRRRSG